MFSHFEQTSKRNIYYIDNYELCKKLNIKTDDSRNIIVNLIEKGLIYKFYDPSLGLTKLGLYGPFLQRIKDYKGIEADISICKHQSIKSSFITADQL